MGPAQFCEHSSELPDSPLERRMFALALFCRAVRIFVMNRRLPVIHPLMLLWALFFASDLSAQEPQPAKTLVELQQQLSNHISQAKFDAAFWGVKVVSFESGKVIFEHNSQKVFSPASNSKLYTVALALDRLGADYRIKTSLYSSARPTASGVLKGDLIVYGRGDPTLNARLHNNNLYAALEPLVAALTNAGVKRIAGDLIGDDSYIHGPDRKSTRLNSSHRP